MIMYQLVILITLSLTANGKYDSNNVINGGNAVIVDPSDPTNPLGKGFYLPELDIYDSRVGGSNVFSDVPADCIIHYPVERISEEKMDQYEDTSSFYRKTATDSKLSADLAGKYTMGFTLNVKTSGVSSGSTDVRGTSLRIWTQTSREVLNDNCYRKSTSRLASDFIKQVQTLPLEISDPKYPQSWQYYENFFMAFGSHIVTQVDMGASIRQWTFAKTSKSYTSKDFELSACANFEGPTDVGQLGINACSSYTSKEAKRVSHYEIHSHIEILGGRDNTSHSLANTRSRSLLKMLLDEGRSKPSPIDYAYTPVWKLIAMKYPGSDTTSMSMRAKADNLRQYYQGFKDYGCSLIEKNLIKLRYFTESIHSSTYQPVYECVLAQQGCRSNSDCHLKGTVTYCYGDRCVEYKAPSEFGVKSWTADIRIDKSECHSCGVNRSCKYHFAPVKAECDRTVFGERKTIWPESTRR